MANVDAGSSPIQRANRVDCLDGPTLCLVAEYLAARAVHGRIEPFHEAAWVCFERACNPYLRRLAASHCCPCTSAADRVQELWIVIIKHIGEYDPARGSFRPWLNKVVRNALKTHGRNGHVFGQLDGASADQLPGRDVDPADACQAAEGLAIAECAVEELRSSDGEAAYQIVHDHIIDELPYAQTAQALGLTVKQVRDRYRRAKVGLRAKLKRLR